MRRYLESVKYEGTWKVLNTKVPMKVLNTKVPESVKYEGTWKVLNAKAPGKKKKFQELK